jgi:hypothetical protein
METRLAVVAPIVANRAANGKPLVPRAVRLLILIADEGDRAPTKARRLKPG